MARLSKNKWWTADGVLARFSPVNQAWLVTSYDPAWSSEVLLRAPVLAAIPDSEFQEVAAGRMSLDLYLPNRKGNSPSKRSRPAPATPNPQRGTPGGEPGLKWVYFKPRLGDERGSRGYRATGGGHDWEIVPSGYHPISGYSRRESKTWWRVMMDGVGKQSFDTLRRAKKWVESVAFHYPRLAGAPATPNPRLEERLGVLFEPLLKRQDEALEKQITKDTNALRRSVRKKFKNRDDVSEYYFGWIAATRDAKRARRSGQRGDAPSLDPDVGRWVDQFGPGVWSALYKAPAYKRRLKSLIEENLAWNRQKLEAAVNAKLGKLPVARVEELSSRRSRQGIEGRYRITLDDGTEGVFGTKSIAAGGYNIQRYHYRYLMKLDPTLTARQEEAPDPVDPKVAAVMAILAKHINTWEPTTGGRNSMLIPDEAKYEVEELKGASRNWGPARKAGFVTKCEYGGYYIKRYNYYLTLEGFEALR